jgi:hypothetical protein
LPVRGCGKLAAATENYLRQGLSRATGGNNTKLLMIYCQADCWMSGCLDVMERGETGAVLRLFQCGLVSRRN